ncbi:MAG TPA: YitT family protein [Candidatus Ruthenibacterium avium]|uniref:YitT family protein n=1 Tax=Candidatus Ruthenibacterium avium TaxID=2838751 RepID=A0A9D2M0X2_9FIRM|nr:YitT family protein [Candidatus Ruthenibacterium avium]
MNQRMKNLALDLGADVIGSILFAAGIYTFAGAGEFAPGGISGLALIINHLWGLPIGITSLALNAPIILFSFRLLGHRFFLKSIRTMIMNTIFVDFIFTHIPVYKGDRLTAALFAGALLGAGLAVIYMRGSSTGGADFLIMSVKKLRPHLSLGQVTMVLDLLIILLGWPVFGDMDSVLYGIVAAFATSLIIDKVMYGMGAGKLVQIITNDGPAVANAISESTERGSTLIRAVGSYTGQDRDVLLCACSKSEAYKVRAAAHRVDPKCFVMITETSEVFGEGFLEAKEEK